MISLESNVDKIIVMANIFVWIIGLFIIYIFYIQQNRYNKKEKEYICKLEELAHYDSLTSLPNRTMFFNYLDKAIEMASRDNKKFVVMFLDLDNFKLINDTHGHPIGDMLLVKIANRVNNLKREYDIFSRIGGDEFLLLLYEENISNIATFAQRVLDVFNYPFELENKQIHISSSMGISFYPKDGNSSKELFQNSDVAMNKAKALGKNNFQFFKQELNDNIKRQLHMGELLRDALTNHEFVLHYQPKIDVKTNETIGLEALIRWERPDFGLVMPSEFIWVAEENGFIKELGSWVIEKVARQIKKWRAKGYKDVLVSINVSAKQFNQKSFLDFIETSCTKKGVGSCIELELTESLLMHDVDKMQEKLMSLKELGIKLSIDDFGTGYSSLSYLKRFPVQTIKIDKSFIDDIVTDSNDLAISESIIALANAMSMDVVAEGVETKDQLDILTKIGCKVVQGYYFSKPLSAQEVEKFLVCDIAKTKTI